MSSMFEFEQRIVSRPMHTAIGFLGDCGAPGGNAEAIGTHVPSLSSSPIVYVLLTGGLLSSLAFV